MVKRQHVTRPLADRRRQWIALLKWLAGIVVLLFLVRSFWKAYREALARDPSFSLESIRLEWLGLAGLLYFLALIPMGAYWRHLNLRLGQRAPVGQTFRAYMIGHLGKYVPGKAMAVVLRTALMKGPQTDATLVAVSVFIETLTMMAVGAGLAAALIAWQFADRQVLLWTALGMMVIAGIPTWPPLVRLAANRLIPAGRKEELALALGGYTLRVMLVGWILELIGWSIMGFSLWSVLRALPLPQELNTASELWPRLTASVSLSMVAGFVSLLPGGLGVREMVLDEFLQGPFGPVFAPLSAILLRLIWMLTELAASIILYIGSRFRRSIAEDAG